ncbi:hypothetical protein HY636_03770 [Candidatus Woesearchaeota archaeon]|nr:hypothetical protein [Candidatus Woesearchaeota archaeon]
MKTKKRNIKTFVQSKKRILIGGAIGVAICLLLFLFYIFVYFPLIDTVYYSDSTDGSTPQWLLMPPTITGHSFPLFSHFIIEGTSVTTMFCKATNPECVNWGNWALLNKDMAGCDTPWIMEGTAGCCVEKIMAPDESCSEKVEIAGFAILAGLLLVIYFILGAVVALLTQKR